MTGRGRSRGTANPQTAPTTQARTGAGRGKVQQTPLTQPSAPVPFVVPPSTIPQHTPSSRGAGDVKGRGKQPQQQQHQQHPSLQQAPSTSRGGNGSGAPTKPDRGSIRARTVITDIIRTRPESIQSKRGSSGQPVNLTTNHFRLLKQPTWNLYQYRVDFSPSIELMGLRKRLIYEQKPTLGGYQFDGTMLFLSTKLSNEVTQFMSKDRDGNPIQTTVKFVGVISMTSATSVQILNLILRRSMEALKLQLVGRNFFDALAMIDIPQYQLQLWPGYLTSIRQHETDILLCAEVTNKVMRTETVYNILQNCLQNRRGGDWQIPFKEMVLGMTVLTAYNNKTYRIDDVNFDLSPKSTFETRDGPVTYMKYYSDRYRINIRDAGQPLLISNSKDRDIRGGQAELISLIPELCRATGMTDNMRNDPKLMAAVAVYTRLASKARIEKLNAFNQRLQSAPDSVSNLQEWNFRLDKNLVELNGRQLPNEKILFANNKAALTNHEADWSRLFRNISMFTSKHLKNWVLIVPQKKIREAEDFVGILQRAGNGMRYEVAKPVIIDIPDDRAQTYYNALDQAMHKDPQLVMCIATNNNADRYSMIKKKCCVERAVPSQVMLVKTITPKPGKDLNSLMSVGTKVVIQISKLGGAPWMVDIPLSGLMVVGFDVCHDAKDKKKSYGALVATMDMKKSFNYFSAVSPHENGEELSNQFALNLIKAVQCFLSQHGTLPDRIIIYRDGVGEGQTNYVFEHEIKNIIAKLDALYNGQTYRFAFIIVSKRINTRFFKGGMNPNPGTVVDDVVTLPERYDFFLISQFSRHGSVSPTNYNVLYDTSGLPPDRIQLFTYKMTHLYYNWSGTLGVPAVCQYAHKLAFIVGNSIHTSPVNLLEKQLYFL